MGSSASKQRPHQASEQAEGLSSKQKGLELRQGGSEQDEPKQHKKVDIRDRLDEVMERKCGHPIADHRALSEVESSLYLGSDADDAVGQRRRRRTRALDQCDICGVVKDLSPVYCQDCDQCICGNCFLKHRRIRTLELCSPGSILRQAEAHESNYAFKAIPDNSCKWESLHLDYLNEILVKTDEDQSDSWVTSVVPITDTIVALADFNNVALKLVDTLQGKVVFRLQLEHKPWSIALLKRDLLAVTCPQWRKIQFVSVKDKRLSLSRTYRVHHCYAIAWKEERMFVSNHDPPVVEIYKRGGGLVATVSTESDGNAIFKNPDFLTATSEAIYVADWGTQNVSKISRDGEVLDTFSDEKLVAPTGIVATGDDHLLVCSLGYHNIHVLTKALACVNVLSLGDHVECPWAIGYCRDSCRVYVTCYNQKNKDNYVYIYGPKM